jgi:hypothetical protein
MIGLGSCDMSGWAWVLMTLWTVFWAIGAVAAVYIAVRLTRDKKRI